MSPLTVLITALSSLGSNKLRTGLALLGIVIGVAAVISTMAIGRGAQEVITSRIQSLGTNLLFVRPESTGQNTPSTLTLEDASALLDPVFSPSVAAVAPELSTFVRLVAGRENTFSQVVGVTPEYQFVRDYPVSSGQFISAVHVQNVSEVAVLGSQIAETLFGFRNPVGQNFRVNGRQFIVIGVLESKGGTSLGNLDNQVLVPITTVYYRLDSERMSTGDVTVQTINAQIRSLDEMDSSIQEIATVLRLRHRLSGDDDFTITSQQETIETLEETTQTFVIFLAAIAGISLLVGGIGIMNIMMVSVTERTREIGVRKAMGAKHRDILYQFVSEATLLSLGGGIVGAVLGVAVAMALDGRSLGGQTFQTGVSGDITLLAVTVAAVIGLFFGIYPAARAAALHPIDALRYE
ncbi:MAG: ABC transporter permease [SAR202 cluster bacterium]|nr:ABC transporter permease [SAR202 cluster bacterium]